MHKEIKRVTTQVLLEMKTNKQKIAMITGYDYSMAKIYDAAGIDIILVGDSASNVMAGHETTLPTVSYTHLLAKLAGIFSSTNPKHPMASNILASFLSLSASASSFARTV